MAMDKQDVSLIFGMYGEGRVNGESGRLIRQQLIDLTRALNQKTYTDQRMIAFSVAHGRTKANFAQGIRDILSSLSDQNFELTIKKINAKPAMQDLKNQLNEMLSSLKVENLKASYDKIGVGASSSSSGNGAEKTKKDLTEINAKLKEIGVTNSKIRNQYGKVTSKLASGANADDLSKAEDLRQLYIKLESATERLQNSRDTATDAEIQNIYKIQQELREMLGLYSKTEKSEEQLAKETSTMHSRFASVQRAAQTALGYTSAKHTEQYRAIQLANAELDAMALNITEIDPVRFEELNAIIKKNVAEIKSLGLATKSWTDVLVKGAEKFTRWFSMSQIIMAAVHGAKQMLDIVKDIDAAMTELKKVTDETDVTYTRFLDNAAARAKKLGATLSDTVNATADFARLGYSIREASSLADAALVYKNVGDGIEDIGTASESVISTMKAFGIEAKNAMDIVNTFNEIGNNFAITSKGVGDALVRSASALASANNSFEESVALITGANSVVQDADKVGGLRPTIQ